MLTFRGTAHGPAGSKSADHVRCADLNDIQIRTTRLTDLPLYVEHNTNAPPAGIVFGSWVNCEGALRVSGCVHNSEVAEKVRNGDLLGLSLGTATTFFKGRAKPFLKEQEELSLVKTPAREHCYIDVIDNKSVSDYRQKLISASKSQSIQSPCSSLPPLPPLCTKKVKLRMPNMPTTTSDFKAGVCVVCCVLCVCVVCFACSLCTVNKVSMCCVFCSRNKKPKKYG